MVERATHHLTPALGGLTVTDIAYRARFDRAGFAYTPAGSSGRFGLSLESLQRGGHDRSIAAGAWRGTGNVALRVELGSVIPALLG